MCCCLWGSPSTPSRLWGTPSTCTGGDVQAQRNFIDYALFISFFPQLVAGPIERSSNMIHQLKERHPFQFENIKVGILPVLWGLFKKMVIADNLAVVVNTVYNNPQGQGGGAFLVATVAFAFQIYCDFSAYSDIAKGSARMLGFRLMENFNGPYFSKSITSTSPWEAAGAGKHAPA